MFPDRLIDRGNKADERIAAGPAVGEMEKGPQYTENIAKSQEYAPGG